MSAAEEGKVEAVAAEAADVPAGADKAVAEESKEQPAAKEKKSRARKAAPKERKPASPAHPPYFQMIKEAILALKEKGGLSSYAIAKHMEERYKAVLPANFRKTLLLQLKNSVAKGKLVKVKGSFKLSEAGKDTAAKNPAAAGKAKQTKTGGKEKNAKQLDGQKKKRKAPAAAKPAAMAKAQDAKSAKAGVKKARKAAASAKPKQPKSIKSPAAKRARKASAA